MSMPYPIELRCDTEQGGFFATHPDLPGCNAQGETADEAVADLVKARRQWLTTKLRRDLPIPEPVPEDLSGRFLLRMSTALHADAARLARLRGISLNLLINNALSDHLGYQRGVFDVCATAKTVAAEEIKEAVAKNLKEAFGRRAGSRSQAGVNPPTPPKNQTDSLPIAGRLTRR
jgi:predicted RNase H-like HicB family nuclease